MKNKIIKLSLKILLIIISSLLITSCENLQNGDPKDITNPWDYLDGGKEAQTIDVDIKETTDLPKDLDITKKLDDENIDTSNIIKINLSSLDTSSTLYTYKKNKVTISNEGTYELSGILNGNVTVEGDASNITIILNNATISTLDSQDTAALIFKQHKGTRTLYIKENSVNTLKDSSADEGSEADEAIIQAKKSDLDIKGNGILNLESAATNTTAIKVKNNLSIIDTTININTTNNGIKAGEILLIKNANINITSGNDGIKTDVEASSMEEASTLTSNPFAGYLYIENSNILISAKDDGLCSNSYILINNNEKNFIDITTNSGAPQSITEKSKESANGKAIRVEGIHLVDDDGNETFVSSNCADNYILAINGGTFNLNSNSDAITSKGNVIIDNGIFNIETGDDGIHAEETTTINGGEINIVKSYEGIEGSNIDITNGTINVTATDDGINAANGDKQRGYQFHIYISGGSLTINSGGDGIDSNGTIQITGGNILVFGPTSNMDAALDADSGIIINGGNVFAFGSSGMVETPSTSSMQYCVVYNLTNEIPANKQFYLKDESDNILFNVTVPKKYQSVVFSTTALVKNKTYNVITNTTTKNVTIKDILTQIGNTMGPGGPRPGGGQSGPGGRW